MPIYEYRCEKCQTIFEHLTTSSLNIGEVACPKCQDKEVSKVLSVTAAKTGGDRLPLAGGGCQARGGFS